MIHGGDIYNKKIDMDYSVNINPYPLPDCIKQTLQKAIENIDKYPEYDQECLREKLSELTGVGIEQIVCGSGASELFMAIVHALEPKEALIVAPSFSGYEYALRASGTKINYFLACEKENFALSEGFIERLEPEIDIVFLGNPNNPTGKYIDPDNLNRILDRCVENEITVVLDECFFHLGKKGRGNEPKYDFEKYPNLIRVGAFTKLFAIPGVRIGYALCEWHIAERIRKHLPEWNVSIPAQMVGIECANVMLTTDFVENSVAFIENEKEYLCNQLEDIGLKVFDSDANFLLLKTNIGLYEKLLEVGILVRDCESFDGLRDGYVRIAIKDRTSNEKLVEEIRKIYGKI